MIVWGGDTTDSSTSGFLNTGAHYSPATDLWRTVVSANAPSPRGRHAAVWTGDEMIVWGGEDAVPPEDPLEDVVEVGILVVGDYDGDGLCGADDCDEINPFCTTDCTDWDGDGYCATHDCDESRPNCTTDCMDADGDGYCVTHDCDDTIATCFTDCTTDLDADGVEDCADTCLDADGDDYGEPGGAGFTCLGTDCDDDDPFVYPGAPEVNDGDDNQCPGDSGYGVIDEITGVCGFHTPENKDRFSWPAQFGAFSYQAARSTDPQFATDCVLTGTISTYWDDTDPVPEGGFYHYLVRSVSPNDGSWGENSAGVERTAICP
jgi:hypothetical protein